MNKRWNPEARFLNLEVSDHLSCARETGQVTLERNDGERVVLPACIVAIPNYTSTVNEGRRNTTQE